MKTIAKIYRTGADCIWATILLSIVVAIPLLNLLAFGYLLAAEGAVARGERIRDAFEVRYAARIGVALLTVLAALGLLAILADAAEDAAIVAPASPSASTLRWMVPVVAALVTPHLALAVLRGARVRHFLRPIRNLRWLIAGGLSNLETDAYVRLTRRAIHLTILGIKGFIAAVVWLAVPGGLLAWARTADTGAEAIAIVGIVTLLPVLTVLPMAQASLAAEDRFAAAFNLRRVASLWRRAPLAFAMSIAVAYVLAVPVHLLRAPSLPPDAVWMLALFATPFVVAGRLVFALAYRRAASRSKAARGWRWIATPLVFTTVLAYALLTFLSPTIEAPGSMGVFVSPMLSLPM